MNSDNIEYLKLRPPRRSYIAEGPHAVSREKRGRAIRQGTREPTVLR